MEKINNLKIFIVENEILIASLLVIVISSLAIWFFLLPNLLDIKKIISEKEILKKRLLVLEKKEKSLSSLDAEFYRDSIQKISQVVTDDKNYVSLFTTFDKLENESGVTIKNTDFQLGDISTKSAAKNSIKGLYNIPMSLEVTGNLGQISKFITLLSGLSNRLITMDEIQFRIVDESINLQMDGYTYYYPLVTTIGRVDTVLPQFKDTENDILKLITEKITSEGETNFQNIPVGKSNLFQ